jgi:hypothetical protein
MKANKGGEAKPGDGSCGRKPEIGADAAIILGSALEDNHPELFSARPASHMAVP